MLILLSPDLPYLPDSPGARLPGDRSPGCRLPAARSALAFLLAGLLFAGIPRPSAGDDLDASLRAAVAYADRKTDDASFLTAISALTAEQRAQLLKKCDQIPPPARAQILYEMARLNEPGAAEALEGLLDRRALTGKLRIAYPGELIRTTMEGRNPATPALQSLAAGLLLAANNVTENNEALNRASKILSALSDDASVAVNDRRTAVKTIGWLHLRKIVLKSSQQSLVKALRFKDDWEVRKLAALYAGVTGDPESAAPLLDALKTENEPTARDVIADVVARFANFAPEVRGSLVPQLAAITEDFNVPDVNRRLASQTAATISGADKPDAQRAWWRGKEKELAEKREREKKPPAGNPPGPQGDEASPVRPAPQGATGSAPGTDAAERECARRILLARNLIAQKEYGKAQDHLKKVLERCPEGKQAEEAKELLKRVESLKDL